MLFGIVVIQGMNMLRTPLCDLLGIQVPIIQAGMGWDKEGMTTPPELVAAVSNAGGLGCLGGSSIRPEVIRERIRAVRELTDKPFGVDITLPKIRHALETMRHEVTIEPAIATAARRAVERMLDVR